jgi:hypothetical protein
MVCIPLRGCNKLSNAVPVPETKNQGRVALVIARMAASGKARLLREGLEAVPLVC